MWINAVELGRSDQCAGNGGSLPASLGADEEVVLPAEGNSAHASLGRVVIELENGGVLLLPKGGQDELVDQDELVEAFKLIAEDGWQVQTHAGGDATIDAALDAYEAVNETAPIGDLRWALMHVFLPSSEAMERMKDMQVLATVQDHALLLGHNHLRYWGEERAGYAIPIRSLLDAGVETSGGTDAPVLPASPFLSISWMTTRQLMNGSVLGPEQVISREEALRLWTIESAYLIGAEEERGSIEVGKLADLAVLTSDLMAVSDAGSLADDGGRRSVARDAG